jgi:lipopolysaccharide export system permease protein
MILLVPLLAVSLAVPPKRSSSGVGIFLSLILIVAIHKVNQYAEQMATQGRIDPVIALWVPFALFAALILWMFWTLAHKPGGQPIGALERLAAKAGKRIGKVLDIGGARRRARTMQARQ